MIKIPQTVDPYPLKLERDLTSGAAAGLIVDLSLYPLDTIKTRLQSQNGFWKSGGFTKIYSGMGSVAIGSAPGAAVFFLSYGYIKRRAEDQLPSRSIEHALAACYAEAAACIIRVPTEVFKTRSQAFPNRSYKYIASKIMETEGPRGFYRGYLSTIYRDIPFSVIQFPIWEIFKARIARFQERECNPLESAAAGSVAGMLAASVTTPLDVAKTRVMLSQRVHGFTWSWNGDVYAVLGDVYRSYGTKGLFAGLLPRTLWMGIGGFIFFGAYEATYKLFTQYMRSPRFDPRVISEFVVPDKLTPDLSTETIDERLKRAEEFRRTYWGRQEKEAELEKHQRQQHQTGTKLVADESSPTKTTENSNNGWGLSKWWYGK